MNIHLIDAIRDAGKLSGISPFAVDKLIDDCKYVERRISNKKGDETLQKNIRTTNHRF